MINIIIGMFATFGLFCTVLFLYFNFAEWRESKKRKIYVQGCSPNKGRDEFWEAELLTDPWGELYTWRYPKGKAGFIPLKSDGTGNYDAHSVRWKLVRVVS